MEIYGIYGIYSKRSYKTQLNAMIEELFLMLTILKLKTGDICISLMIK